MFRVEDATIVVTGGTGFLGGAVVSELERAGARVIGLGSAHYDLRDRAAVDGMLAATRPDAVIHLAAMMPPATERMPAAAQAVNVDATVGLVRAMEASHTAARLVFASSMVVAGFALWLRRRRGPKGGDAA